MKTKEQVTQSHLSKIRRLSLEVDRLRLANADLQDRLREWEECYGDMKKAHYWELSGRNQR